MEICKTCGTTICEHGQCPACHPCNPCYQKQKQERQNERRKP